MTHSRAHHIRDMRERCKSVNPVSSGDDSRWFIQLVDKNMKELYKILVYLPPEFPSASPTVTVSHALDHPWVNPATRVVSFPPLMSWTKRSDVGIVLMDILREFTTKKPMIIDNESSRRRASTVQTQSGPILETVAMPPIPADFPELLALKEEELELLDSDASVLDGFITNLSILSKYRMLKQDQLDSNVVKATKSLSLHNELAASHSQLETRRKELLTLHGRLRERLLERDALMMKFTPKTLASDLNNIADETDAQTTAILSEFELNEESKAAILQQRILHHKAKALGDLISAHSGSRIIGSISPSLRRYFLMLPLATVLPTNNYHCFK